MRYRYYLIIFLAFVCIQSVRGQMRFGISDTLNPSAILQVDTGTGIRKGLLLPRVALKSTNDFAPLGAHIAGMVVYNSVTAGLAPNQVFPGYYFNDGTQWNRILSEKEIARAWLDANNGNPAFSDTAAIYHSGKLGLGVSSPSEMLDVKGNVKVENGANTGSLLLKPGDALKAGSIEFKNADNAVFGTISSDTSNMTYQTINSTKHHVFQGGNVGIGTTTPPVKLEINGAIKIGNDIGTTTAPSEGMIRFNSTTGKFQGYNGVSWIDMH